MSALSPATPSELLSFIIAHQRHPTTILISWPKQVFLAALVQDVKSDISPSPSSSPRHDLIHAPLLHTAVSRHIRLAFVSTVTHLRAYLATFSTSDSKISAPPNHTVGDAHQENHQDDDDDDETQPPKLLVYGLLEVHRDGSEWSAQGLGVTIAALVEAATRNALTPTIVEPRGALGYETLDEFLDEEVPILSGGGGGGGSSKGRIVPIRRVLSRWFEL